MCPKPNPPERFILSPDPTPAIEVDDLSVTFQRREGGMAAVSNASFSLARGEVLTILGESGSGKSVTLKAMMGLLPGYAKVTGAVRVEGRDILTLLPRELARARGGSLSMIFQEPMAALDPVYTIGAQIAETIVQHEGISYQAATKRALELLERVSIPSAAQRLKNYPHEMSGGMRQRAMIALALSCNPTVLLADEPTTALDVTVQIQILLLLRQLQQELGMSVIFVTHDVGVAAEISDRIAVMYAGRFVETGTVRQIMRAPRHPYTKGLLTSTVHGGLRGRRLETIPGSPPSLSMLPPGCAFAPRCALADEACDRAQPPLVQLSPGTSVRCLKAEQQEFASS